MPHLRAPGTGPAASYTSRGRAARRLTTAVVLAAALGGCGSDGATEPTPDPVPTATGITFTSDTGDWIGQGTTRRFTYGDGTWTAFASSYADTPAGGASQVVIELQQPTALRTGWRLWVQAPPGEALQVGRVYANAKRVGFADGGPGLSFTGDGRGCNGSLGQFEITDLVRGRDNLVDRARVVFEQYCDQRTAALRGEVTVVANPWR